MVYLYIAIWGNGSVIKSPVYHMIIILLDVPVLWGGLLWRGVICWWAVFWKKKALPQKVTMPAENM